MPGRGGGDGARGGAHQNQGEHGQDGNEVERNAEGTDPAEKVSGGACLSGWPPGTVCPVYGWFVGMASCHRHARPQHMRLPSAKTGSQLVTRQRREPVSSSRYSHRSVSFTTHPGFRPGVIIEKPRSYSFGVCGDVTSVPDSATCPNLQEHFAPLSPTSYVHNGTPRTHCKYQRQAYWIWGGRTGRSPCLTQCRILSCSFHPIAGTEGPKRLRYFLSCIHPGRSYRFKLSTRLEACRALPLVTIALARAV